ncbi:hypothetical protein [Oleidesulfovibrio alaskensis]|uniref:hypothetical protein n=1 Tax=Oleidesulfovibrio alaskensis TaxID=58180 RepID=UPI003B59AAE6
MASLSVTGCGRRGSLPLPSAAGARSASVQNRPVLRTYAAMRPTSYTRPCFSTDSRKASQKSRMFFSAT